jgi:hypothetical protein
VAETPDDPQAWEDAAVDAILRGLDRTGHQRGVLAELSPREQETVFAAEARHRGRRVSPAGQVQCWHIQQMAERLADAAIDRVEAMECWHTQAIDPVTAIRRTQDSPEYQRAARTTRRRRQALRRLAKALQRQAVGAA